MNIPWITTLEDGAPPAEPETPRPGARPFKCGRLSADEEWQQVQHFLHWQSLIDRGLIGNNPPDSPEVVAQREANDALFRRRAREFRGW